MELSEIKNQVDESTVELIKLLEKLKKEGVDVSVSFNNKYDKLGPIVPSISIDI